MFPIALNIQTLPILLIGSGEAFEKRKAQLTEAGAQNFFCHHAFIADIAEPSAFTWHDIAGRVRHDSKIVMIVGLDYSTSEMISREARALGKIVNVEDVPELCDFYFMSMIKRGDLTIAISTNGASPTIAKRLRDYIARRFGLEWAGYLDEMKQHRLALRAEGKNMGEVMRSSDALLAEKGWLACKNCHSDESRNPDKIEEMHPGVRRNDEATA